MKKLVKEYTFNEEQLNYIRSLARELNLTEITVKLLCARGVDTAEKIKEFLTPSKAHFLSPFLMQGMREGIDLIRRARDEGWNVAVFGDYDADGICASSVMYYALKAFGIDAQIYIP
jgi:single-stranded-DNA-specific exonuclease